MSTRLKKSTRVSAQVNFEQLPDETLKTLWSAATQLVKTASTLVKAGQSPAARFVHSDPNQSIISAAHLPDGDVFDDTNGYQFYCHSHRSLAKELAHIHLFFHATPSGRRRKAVPWGSASPSHLVAISLGENGWPNGFFIPNLCITDGYWLSSKVIVKRIQTLDLSQVAKKHRVLARFIQNLLIVSLPNIQALLAKRDELIERATATSPLKSVLADTSWEILCHQPFDLQAHISKLEHAVSARHI